MRYASWMPPDAVNVRDLIVLKYVGNLKNRPLFAQASLRYSSLFLSS